MRQQMALQCLYSHVPCRSRRNVRSLRSTRYWGGEDEVFSNGVADMRKFIETGFIDRLMPRKALLFSGLKNRCFILLDGNKII